MHACVIGSGVIGVTTAWQLVRNGWRVTLLDAADQPATGTSHANGGQLSYSYVAPLAEPGVLPDIPRWLFNPESPLRFRPRLDVQQWRWCLQFLLACNARTARRSTAALLALANLSRQTLADWLAETPIAFEHRQNGKLIVYRSQKLLDKARALVEYERRLGAEQQMLDAAGCVALEPALAPVRQKIAGAVYTPSEEAGDCRQFTQDLFARLAADPNVRIRMGTPIARLVRGHGKISCLQTHEGEELVADHFVVAAGMGSLPLLGSLGRRPLLYALTGYSLSVDAAGAQVPAISVTDYERRTVYAQLGDTLRVAAMVGLGVQGNTPDTGRIALLKRQVGELLPALDLANAQPWVGARPATPTGLPHIGRSAAATNLWLNIGHGALGFTLACGSARLLHALMSDAEPAIDPAAFAARA